MQTKSVFLVFLTLLLLGQFFLAPVTLTAYLPRRGLFTSTGIKHQSLMQATDIRFGSNILVTDGTSTYPQQVEPTLAILSSGRILAGWKEAATHNGPGLRVGFATSTDNGKTFSSNILMNTVGGGSQSDPWLMADHQDNAYFVFLEYGGSREGMGVGITTDGGATWQGPYQASNTPGFDDKETLCIDASGNLYMVWDHFVDANNADLVFTKSTNGGTNWQNVLTLGPWEERGGIPYITSTSNGSLYISTILDSNPLGPIDTILITKSTDGGATWTNPRQVNPLGMGEIAIITVCATDSQNNVYILFAADSSSNKEVFLIKSTDGGTTWSTPIQVNDDTTGMQRMVEMTIDTEDTIHVAWLDARAGEWNIYYDHSTDGGVTFSDDVLITTEGTPLSYTRPGDYFTLRSGPQGELHIVWTDGRGDDQDIYYAHEDVAAPVITHWAPIGTFGSSPFTLTAEVTDDDQVDQVFIHFQPGSLGPWQTEQMISRGNNLYEATILSQYMTGSSISYFISATDVAGRQSTLNSEIDPIIVSITPFSPTMVITIIGSAIILIVVIIFAIWYLRRPTKK